MESDLLKASRSVENLQLSGRRITSEEIQEQQLGVEQCDFEKATSFLRFISLLNVQAQRPDRTVHLGAIKRYTVRSEPQVSYKARSVS